MDQNHPAYQPFFFSRRTSLVAKGIASILMLNHHLFFCCPELMEEYSVSSVIFSYDHMINFSSISKICVAVFVFLTAYGTTAGGGIEKNDLFRRLKRLLFSFWVIFAFSILTFPLRSDKLNIYLPHGKLMSIVYMLLDACGLSSLTGTPLYNETWWYMSLAIFLIFLLPVVIALYDKFGVSILVVSLFIPYVLPVQDGSLYLFVVVLGIWAARSNYFHILKDWSSKHSILLPVLGSSFLIYILGRIRLTLLLAFWTDALMALLVITLVFLLVDCTPLKLRGLAFIGNHSMNIFLVHTLLFEYYFTKWIYAPGNWILITLLLLAASLLVSIILTPIQNTALKFADQLHRRKQHV
ncbi:MAG: hypothetical protein Q4B03_08805 [Lachnospiraceae bacterium]|nr:hypothetical protein [Lachnospiraceae bacterium]